MILALSKCSVWPVGLYSAPVLTIDEWPVEAKMHVHKFDLTKTPQCFVIRILYYVGVVTVYVSEIGM
jgi:hypothetical protein